MSFVLLLLRVDHCFLIFGQWFFKYYRYCFTATAVNFILSDMLVFVLIYLYVLYSLVGPFIVLLIIFTVLCFLFVIQLFFHVVMFHPSILSDNFIQQRYSKYMYQQSCYMSMLFCCICLSVIVFPFLVLVTQFQNSHHEVYRFGHFFIQCFAKCIKRVSTHLQNIFKPPGMILVFVKMVSLLICSKLIWDDFIFGYWNT